MMKDGRREESAPNPESCFTKLLYPCVNFISFLNNGQIHPLEPVTPSNSEYVIIDNSKKIRVIHVKPKPNFIQERAIKIDKRLSRCSFSEEYWFTQWSKPLRTDVCNCSFRRSARFSKISDDFAISLSRRGTASFSVGKRKSRLSGKIGNIESFVESLVQESLKEAFKEFSSLNFSRNRNISNFSFDEVDCAIVGNRANDVKNSSITVNGAAVSRNANKGVVNLGFIPVEEDISENQVQLRMKIEEPRVQLIEGIRNLNRKENVERNSVVRRKNCVHAANGIKNKPLVMLLHGIGSSADVWWTTITNLQNKGYEVVAPDMLGHGFSSVPNQPKEYSFKNLLNIALLVFEHYIPTGQSRKCILIGHSFGCSIATALYKYKAQQIAQMVLISGGGPTPLVSAVRDDMTVYTCLRTIFKPLLFCGVKRSFFYASRGKHFTSCQQNNAIPEYVLRYIYDGQNWPEGDAAYHRRIMVPTLLVHGLQDTNVTLVQECEMERTIPRSFLELIPNAGHIAMLETPEQLSHMILCFIEWWTY